MKKYIVQPGQSLFDVAILTYGDASGAAFLMVDNGLSGPVERLFAGQVLLYRSDAINQRQKAYLEDYPIIATISEQEKPSGIGFWRLDEYAIPGILFELEPYQTGDNIIRFSLDHEGEFLTKIINQTTSIVLVNEILEYLDSFSRARGFGTSDPGIYLVEIDGYLRGNITINTL